MLIYPAIDIYQGNCVRLRKGDFASQNVYSDSPSTVAQSFRDAGLTSLHVVDLEGAKAGHIINWGALDSILEIGSLQVQVGGGIRTLQDISRLFDAGAARVVIGSLAVESPHIVQDWIRKFGTDRFVIAVDVRDGAVAHKGWLEHAHLTPSAFVETMSRAGVSSFLCTDINLDGMLGGPNLELYRSILTEFPFIQLVASGGVSQISDIESLAGIGCYAAVVGKALYEGKVTTEQLARFERAGAFYVDETDHSLPGC
jgi:phosphoribosylformimino-5-aminoimidazole carboxamide ribotide isomerase